MDNDLKGVADIVNEAIAADEGSDVGFGAKTQTELDAEQGKSNDTEEAAKPPVIPAEGFKAQVPPVQASATPVRAGDKVVNEAPLQATDETLAATLEEIFPGRGFKSLDDVKASNLNETLTNAEKATLRAKELEEKNNEYQSKLSQKLNPFANDEIAELNQFIKETGITDQNLFKTLKNTDLDNIDPKDVMIMKIKKDHPSLSHEEAVEYVEDEFKLTKFTPDESMYDDDEIAAARSEHDKSLRRAMTRLKIASDGAKKEFAELKEKIKPVDLNAQIEQNRQATDQKIAEATASWTPHIAKSVDEIRNFPINLPGEDGVNKTVATFSVPEAKLTEYKVYATQFAIDNNIPATDNGMKAVNKFISDMVLVDHKDQIIQKAISATKAGLETEIDRSISNPSGTSLPPVPGQDSPKSVRKTAEQLEDEVAEGAMNILNKGDY